MKRSLKSFEQASVFLEEALQPDHCEVSLPLKYGKCTGKSRSEIYDLSLKPDRVVKLLRDVKERIAASENTTIAANDMVELRYKGKQAKLEQQINGAEKTLESIRRKWTDTRIGDLEEKIITLKEL